MIVVVGVRDRVQGTIARRGAMEPAVGRVALGTYYRSTTLAYVAEELRPEPAFGLQGQYENIWHIAAAERWSDGRLIGHRTFCGRNYSETVEQRDLEGLPQVCSDCTAQRERPH